MSSAFYSFDATENVAAQLLAVTFADASLFRPEVRESELANVEKILTGCPAYAAASVRGETLCKNDSESVLVAFFSDDKIAPFRCLQDISARLPVGVGSLFCAAIHCGPMHRVVEAGEAVTMYGEGAIVVRQILACADAGHILVSGYMAKQIRQTGSVLANVWVPGLKDLGLHRQPNGSELHLWNLTKNNLGNPACPRKLTTAQEHLAFILDMDIVKSSRFSENELVTVYRNLMETVRGTTDFQQAEAQGKLICRTEGDRVLLLFFTDLKAPFRCAEEITLRLRELKPRIELRMGIHSGYVRRVPNPVDRREDATGEAIMICARTQSQGDARHILVSKAVGDHLYTDPAWKSRLRWLVEMKVGEQTIGIYNLVTETVGNPEIPRKVFDSPEYKERMSAALKLPPSVVQTSGSVPVSAPPRDSTPIQYFLAFVAAVACIAGVLYAYSRLKPAEAAPAQSDATKENITQKASVLEEAKPLTSTKGTTADTTKKAEGLQGRNKKKRDDFPSATSNGGSGVAPVSKPVIESKEFRKYAFAAKQLREKLAANPIDLDGLPWALDAVRETASAVPPQTSERTKAETELQELITKVDEALRRGRSSKTEAPLPNNGTATQSPPTSTGEKPDANKPSAGEKAGEKKDGE